jgi:TonB family protein
VAIQSLYAQPTFERGRIPGAFLCSIVAHVVLLVVILWVAATRPVDVAPQPTVREQPERIVWIAMPGPSGGGGGSKAPVPTPPKPVPPPPAQAVAQPAPTPVPTQEPAPEPEPLEPQPAIPAAISTLAMAGATSAPAATPGLGTGTGSGDGVGAGAGPGQDRGFGGGAYRPGNGVSAPVPVTRAPPRYTAAAMRARAQGVITVECVVEPNGTCGDVRIVRAFAPPFGLDDEAIDAARRWRFRPGMRGSEAVPVVVHLEIEFNIR